MDKIPLSEPSIGQLEIAAVTAVLKSKRLSQGNMQTAFEHGMAEYCQTVGAVAVSSGTAGLKLALEALKIGPGDEVITTPFTFIASVNVIVQCGATPVFVDICADTLNMDTRQIEAAITTRTRAILVVHLFGRPVSMAPIIELVKQTDIKIIEDACEALGAHYQNKAVGSVGDVGVFGFYPNKVITTGEGGMIVSNNKALLERCRILRNQGRAPQSWDFLSDGLGYNYRLSELQCALGYVQLQQIDSFLALREHCVKIYIEQLETVEELTLPDLHQDQNTISWFAFIVQLTEGFTCKDRDNLIKGMAEAGVECGIYFPAVHLQAYYQIHFGFSSGLFPVTEGVAHRVIALPLFAELNDKAIQQVCLTLKKHLMMIKL